MIYDTLNITKMNMNMYMFNMNEKNYFLPSVGIGIGLAMLYFPICRYKTSRSHEWLVRTGLSINDMQIGKKFIRWPFQNIDHIDMTPKTYRFSITAMSKEKMEFNFPAAFTIGPQNKMESLKNYARYSIIQDEQQLSNMIISIIEGETRALAANLSIEEIFSGRSVFKNEIVTNVQTQLDKLGSEIFNANIEKLEDSANSNYFFSLSQKIKAEAENRAKVEVAEQTKIGDVGSKEREAETRQKISIIEAETTLVENHKEQEILKSKAALEKLKAEQELIIEYAKIESVNRAAISQMEYEKDVQIKRSLMEIEKQRATDLSFTQVQAEIKEKNAIGDANSQKILADANFYKMQKEADGIKAIYDAKAEGLLKIVNSFGGNHNAMLSYTMIDKNIYQELAKSNADAIRGLNPKITVWTHDASKAMDPIQNLGKSIIPMLDTIENQTGYKLPDWILSKNNEMSKSTNDGMLNQKKITNFNKY